LILQIGLIGLGRMDANMSRRRLRNGHTVIGYGRVTLTRSRAWSATTQSPTAPPRCPTSRLSSHRHAWPG
jgi:6-phosphogluconate dehydrogenase (decarboxylating)